MDDKLALQIGKHVLEQYNKWTENPRGKAICIPVTLPHRNDQPEWSMAVTCEMPWFVEFYWENGERKYKHWSMKEWYEHSGAK